MLSVILLLFLGIIWGTGYSIARYATISGVSPLGYSFWQSLGPAIVLTIITLVTQKKFSLKTSHLKYYFISGLTGIIIPNTNMYFAAPHLPAGLLAVIVNIVPIIAYPLALFAKIESLQWNRVLGLGCAMIGLMFILIPKTSLPSPEMIPWVLSSLITPFSFAFCAIYIARHRPETGNSFALATGTLIASSLILLPWVVLSHHFYMLHWPLTTPDQVIILEILLSSIGYVLLFQLIKMAGPVYYSLVDAVVAVTGLVWGYIIFNEHLNHWTLPAVCLIILALLLMTKKNRV